MDKLEKKALDKTPIDDEFDDEDNWDDDLLFHILFFPSYNNTSMPQTNKFSIGLSKTIDTNTNLQVGIIFDSSEYIDSNKEFNIPYDDFENDSLDYQATGLRVGVNKIIYQNIISTQIAVGIMRSTFENEVTNTLLDSSIGYTIEISMGVIFPYWDAMSIQFVTGYDLNGIKNKDNEDLLNSPFIGMGVQILGDWF